MYFIESDTLPLTFYTESIVVYTPTLRLRVIYFNIVNTSVMHTAFHFLS